MYVLLINVVLIRQLYFLIQLLSHPFPLPPDCFWYIKKKREREKRERRERGREGNKSRK
jgi:hypothetical protein